MVAPEKYRRFLSYAVGYCVLVCEISVAAGCALNSANIAATFVAITHPDVDWKVSLHVLYHCRWSCYALTAKTNQHQTALHDLPTVLRLSHLTSHNWTLGWFALCTICAILRRELQRLRTCGMGSCLPGYGAQNRC